MPTWSFSKRGNVKVPLKIASLGSRGTVDIRCRHCTQIASPIRQAQDGALLGYLVERLNGDEGREWLPIFPVAWMLQPPASCAPLPTCLSTSVG